MQKQFHNKKLLELIIGIKYELSDPAKSLAVTHDGKFIIIISQTEFLIYSTEPLRLIAKELSDQRDNVAQYCSRLMVLDQQFYVKYHVECYANKNVGILHQKMLNNMMHHIEHFSQTRDAKFELMLLLLIHYPSLARKMLAQEYTLREMDLLPFFVDVNSLHKK